MSTADVPFRGRTRAVFVLPPSSTEQTGFLGCLVRTWGILERGVPLGGEPRRRATQGVRLGREPRLARKVREPILRVAAEVWGGSQIAPQLTNLRVDRSGREAMASSHREVRGRGKRAWFT